MPTELIMSRVRRILMLDSTAFEEVRDDRAFTPYALGLAAIAAFLGGFGTFLWSAIDLDETHDFFVEATLIGSILLILLWAAGVAIAYVVLTQVYKATDITPEALVRVMAMGHLPFAATLFIFIPEIGFSFGVLAIAAMFFYTIFGLRSAFPSVEPLRIMITVIAAFAVWTMILPLLTSSSNQFAPGTFAFEWTEDYAEDVTGAFHASGF